MMTLINYPIIRTDMTAIIGLKNRAELYLVSDGLSLMYDLDTGKYAGGDPFTIKVFEISPHIAMGISARDGKDLAQYAVALKIHLEKRAASLAQVVDDIAEYQKKYFEDHAVSYPGFGLQIIIAGFDYNSIGQPTIPRLYVLDHEYKVHSITKDVCAVGQWRAADEYLDEHMPGDNDSGDDLIKLGVDTIKYVAEKPDVNNVGGATRVWRIGKVDGVNQLAGPVKLTDAQLAELLKSGGRDGAKPDFDKLVKKAAKPKK